MTKKKPTSFGKQLAPHILWLHHKGRHQWNSSLHSIQLNLHTLSVKNISQIDFVATYLTMNNMYTTAVIMYNTISMNI